MSTEARKASPLAVTVSIVVTVDVDAWRLAYGDDTRAQIADSVRRSVLESAGPEGGTFASDAGIIAVRRSRA